METLYDAIMSGSSIRVPYLEIDTVDFYMEKGGRHDGLNMWAAFGADGVDEEKSVESSIQQKIANAVAATTRATSNIAEKAESVASRVARYNPTTLLSKYTPRKSSTKGKTIMELMQLYDEAMAPGEDHGLGTDDDDDDGVDCGGEGEDAEGEAGGANALARGIGGDKQTFRASHIEGSSPSPPSPSRPTTVLRPFPSTGSAPAPAPAPAPGALSFNMMRSQSLSEAPRSLSAPASFSAPTSVLSNHVPPRKARTVLEMMEQQDSSASSSLPPPVTPCGRGTGTGIGSVMGSVMGSVTGGPASRSSSGPGLGSRLGPAHGPAHGRTVLSMMREFGEYEGEGAGEERREVGKQGLGYGRGGEGRARASNDDDEEEEDHDHDHDDNMSLLMQHYNLGLSDEPGRGSSGERQSVQRGPANPPPTPQPPQSPLRDGGGPASANSSILGSGGGDPRTPQARKVKTKEEIAAEWADWHWGVPFRFEVQIFTARNLRLYAQDYLNAEHSSMANVDSRAVKVDLLNMRFPELSDKPKKRGEERGGLFLDDLTWRVVGKLINELFNSNKIAMVTIMANAAANQTRSAMVETANNVARGVKEELQHTKAAVAEKAANVAKGVKEELEHTKAAMAEKAANVSKGVTEDLHTYHPKNILTGVKGMGSRAIKVISKHDKAASAYDRSRSDAVRSHSISRLRVHLKSGRNLVRGDRAVTACFCLVRLQNQHVEAPHVKSNTKKPSAEGVVAWDETWDLEPVLTLKALLNVRVFESRMMGTDVFVCEMSVPLDVGSGMREHEWADADWELSSADDRMGTIGVQQEITTWHKLSGRRESPLGTGGELLLGLELL